jgi:hypothetical protein
MALRYVILCHDGVPEPHFDLMFETAEGSALATWRSANWPPTKDSLKKLSDHRREYLDYQGPVGAGRGDVRQVEVGMYERLPGFEPILAFKLHGPRERVLYLRPVGFDFWAPWLAVYE